MERKRGPIARAWHAVCESGKRVLAWRYLPAALAVLGVAFSWPALKAGFLNDDFMQRAILVGSSPMTERLDEVGLAPEGSGQLGYVLADLYVAASPEKNLTALTDYGALPWWTSEDYRVAFWRPLASLTYWLDYRLFPDSLALMHLHSLLWFAAVVLLVALLYRRYIDTAWVAGLAGLFFVIDDSTYFPTMWLANRNLLICLVFALLTLIFYDRWRRNGWRPGMVAAPLCLLASVLSAEAGIATCAYLFVYEVTLGRGRWTTRLTALLPSAATVVLWRLAYNLLGYGAAGGGFYFDPVREPVGYALVILKRAPFLLSGQWTTLPPELHSFVPFWAMLLIWSIMTVVAIGFPLLMLPFLRCHARARFWLLGMYLSALPFCATIPMGRSLAFIAIGAFGLIAEFVAGAKRGASWMPQGWWRVNPILWLGTFLVFAHGPFALFFRLVAPGTAAAMGAEAAKVTQLGVFGAVDQQDLVVVNAPNPSAFIYEPFSRAYDGRPLPRRVRMLAPGFGEVLVERPAERQLVVRSAEDSLFDCQRHGRADFVYFYRYLSDVRGTGPPLRTGDEVTLPGMTARVEQVDEKGAPAAVRFEFDVPLEDRSLRWLWWDWDEDVYRLFHLPAVGEAKRLVGPF
ncbi:MAG: hypothetical protein JW993_04755 [Sedimentisphaerales bacterium]|nr:hypothetical protein [Sedimentisphaerales bacterium]